jgi:flagellar protein FliO/FliZ
MTPPPVFLLPTLFALAASILFSGSCQAASDALAIPDPLASLWQMFFGLALVLGILAVSVWLLKRFSSPVHGNGLLRILGITAVGPREKVVLLEVGEKILMLGVTSNNVRTLHVFERDELPLASTSATSFASPGLVSAATFASRLAKALKGRRNAD